VSESVDKGKLAVGDTMKKHLITIIWPIWFIFLSGCSTDPNEKANELYVKASQLMQSAITEKESYSKVLESYNRAQKEIESILSKYASSNIAVSLMAGKTRISGFTLNEFKKLESSLKPLAESEQKPLSCALLVARTIKIRFCRDRALTKIVGKYADAEQFSQALKVAKTILFNGEAFIKIAVKYADVGQFAQALKVPERILLPVSKAEAFAKIAAKYAEIGQKEKADQILSQALELAKTIEAEENNSYALTRISAKYAELGQFGKALETAKIIKGVKAKADAFAPMHLLKLPPSMPRSGNLLKLSN